MVIFGQYANLWGYFSKSLGRITCITSNIINKELLQLYYYSLSKPKILQRNIQCSIEIIKEAWFSSKLYKDRLLYMSCLFAISIYYNNRSTYVSGQNIRQIATNFDFI
jgi:hypothetical protein